MSRAAVRSASSRELTGPTRTRQRAPASPVLGLTNAGKPLRRSVPASFSADAARGLQFDEAALDWLLRRHSRDLSALGALFDRLDRASLAAQRRLTVPFLRQVLEPGAGQD